MTTRVVVSIDGDDVLAGVLYAHRGRGAESATFRYADGYLARPDAYALDPGLPLTAVAHQTAVGVPIFRAMADGSPDRWGRNLLLRQERLRARELDRTPRSLGELDLLLGVRDDLRQGALRYQTVDDATFLAPPETGVPLLTDLPALLSAADRVAADEPTSRDLALLVRAGSSLGGARPKAHVLSADGRLAIAKFPSPGTDHWNVMAWEKTALDLAARAGVVVSPSQLVKVGNRDVLVVDRFDRAAGKRLGYASGVTMLETRDGDPGSYLGLALVVEERSTAATAELEQLWRRLVFNVAISNIDDHLRNHGFLHQRGESWRLSPAFDLNPDPAGTYALTTAINESERSASVELVMSVAPAFRLTGEAARHVVGEVCRACSGWRDVARQNGLSSREIADMTPAFDHAAARDAARLGGR